MSELQNGTAANTQGGQYTREHVRYDVNLTARFCSPKTEFGVVVTNLSGGGACFGVTTFISDQVPEDGFDLVIGDLGRFACRTAWRSRQRCGVAFLLDHFAQNRLAEHLADTFAREPRSLPPPF